jgi:hypothetical protein
MQHLISIACDKVLPLLDNNLLALIDLAASHLVPPGHPLPSIGKHPNAKALSTASDILRESADWSALDTSVLGILYESFLENGEPVKSKQSGRRKSGIFYTPDYITKFLVQAALDSCDPSLKVSVPRVLDPACGCGAFLISAFRELCAKYLNENPEKIASACLHGIDSDPDAVKVARLSIFIEASLPKKAWPILENTIRVGNSLEIATEGNAHFPIVVGNPPYRNLKRGISDELKAFCKEHFQSATGQWDIAAPFVEATLSYFLAPGGSYGFILPNPILLAENYEPLRKIILSNNLVAFGPAGRPFPDPGVEASLLVGRRSKPGNKAIILDATNGQEVSKKTSIPIKLLDRLPFHILSHLADDKFLTPILDALDSKALRPLGDFVKFTRGLEFGKNDDRVIDIYSNNRSTSLPLHTGDSVEEYCATAHKRFIIQGDKDLHRTLKDPSLWEGEAILLLRRVADHPIAAITSPLFVALNTLYVVHGENIDYYSTCALFNSTPFREIFTRLFSFDDRLFPYLRTSQLSRMPVPQKALTDGPLSECSHEIHWLKRNTGFETGEKVIKIKEQIDSIIAKMYAKAIS